MRPASTSLVAHIRVHKWISIPVDFVSWVQPAHYPLILRPALAFAGNFEALLRLTVAFLSSSSSHRPALASAGNFEALLRLAVALLRLTVTIHSIDHQEKEKFNAVAHLHDAVVMYEGEFDAVAHLHDAVAHSVLF
ncbi:hypothetical protein YC2023_024182 [Brassica napus]